MSVAANWRPNARTSTWNRQPCGNASKQIGLFSRSIQRFYWLNFKRVAAEFRPRNPGEPRVGNQEGILKNTFMRFLADQAGATAIEYGLIAAGISLAIIAAVNGLGSTLNTSFSTINTSLK
jgi:pilus assembly protein Flp/PilA